MAKKGENALLGGLQKGQAGVRPVGLKPNVLSSLLPSWPHWLSHYGSAAALSQTVSGSMHCLLGSSSCPLFTALTEGPLHS
jgi:hypothetical protein